MARKKAIPAITHTETLCYAIYYLEQDVRRWAASLEGHPEAEESLSHICERQLRQLDALKQMYKIETGEGFC